VVPNGTRQGPTPVASKRYERHEPEATPLYKTVAEHLEAFLAEAREKHERALPQYVERELREYLKCGISTTGRAVLRRVAQLLRSEPPSASVRVCATIRWVAMHARGPCSCAQPMQVAQSLLPSRSRK
jgi:selenocysteine lyase/cysteine desulfurase